MPTATFVADFSKWNVALKDAAATLKPLELAGKNARAQLQAMANSLNGTNIQKQAQLAVQAVKLVGDATNLTKKEQAALNVTLTEAIAKYKALGQQAPADMVKLQKETKQTESALAGIGSALGPLAGLFAGAFAVSTIKNLAGDALKFASDLNDLSAKTGISVEALQEFKFAGAAVGVTLDDISTSVLQMQKRLVGDDKSAVAGLEKLGLSVKQLQGLHPEDQFTQIATALSKIEDPAVRNKLAFDIMGKSAAAVLPLIASGLDQARQKARELGIVIDQDAINKLDELGDTWAAVKLAGEAFIAKALVPLAPAATAALNALLPLAAKIGELPRLFIQAEMAAIRFAKRQTDDAAAFLGSAAGTFTNPLGKLTGQTDKEVFQLHGASIIMQNDLNHLQEQLDGLGKAATTTHTPLKNFNTDLSESSGKTKKAADDTDKLRDELNAVRDDILKVSDAIDKMFTKDAEEAAKKEAAALKEFSDAVNDLTGQSGLEKALFDFDALNAAIAQGGATAEGTKKVYDEISVAINAILSGGAHLTGSLEEQTAQWDKLTQAAADFSALHPIEPLKEDLPPVIKETKDLDKSIGELSKALANLAQISGGTFGRIFTALSSIVGAADTGLKAFDAMKDGISQIGKKGAGLGDLVKGFSSLSSGILGAVSAAIALGKALVGIFKKDRAAEEVKSLAKEFGVAVSKEFGQQIEDLAKNMFGGNRQAAKIFNLDQIISQGGGITAKNLGALEDRFHDVFSLVQTGALTGSQAMTVLDKNFQTFADFLGGDVDPALKEIIRLNKEFGTGSKAILDFVAKNANVAAGGFNKIAANIAAIPGTLNRIGPIAEATFGALLDGGDSVVEALAAMGPGIDAVSAALKGAGQSATGFIAQVLGWQSIVENNKGVFDALSGTLDVLKGLNNAGSLTQDVFAQLAGTIDDAFNALVAQGVSGTDALKLMQPQLQEIWELQKDFGYAVDAGTQALLDQAIAAGEVGEKHRSIQEQTLDVMKHLDAVLAGIGQKFGVTIPSDIDKTGAAFDRLGNKIGDAVDQIPDHINIPIDFPTGPYQQGPTSAPYSQGGPVYAARGMFVPRGTDTVPAMLTPGEGVLSRRGMHALGQLNAGGGAAAAAPTVVIMQIDKREIGRAIADVLPGELRRLGVRVRT